MKILLLNGSPRKNGNTDTGLKEILLGIEENMEDVICEKTDINPKEISPCINCNGCKKNGGNCVMPDKSKEIIQKVYESDCVIFGSPVYWWGISAQLKMVIDKFYSKDEAFQEQKKKIGWLTVGANGLEDSQYNIIRSQYQCIANYLGWDITFETAISAYEKNDLQNNNEEKQKLYDLWKTL